jgi:ribosomal protein L21
MADTYAIVESGGKQYKVEKGETLLLDRLPAKEGEKVDLRAVMFRDSDVVTDATELEKVKVEATVEITDLKKLARTPAAKKPEAKAEPKAEAPKAEAAAKPATRKTTKGKTGATRKTTAKKSPARRSTTRKTSTRKTSGSSSTKKGSSSGS